MLLHHFNGGLDKLYKNDMEMGVWPNYQKSVIYFLTLLNYIGSISYSRKYPISGSFYYSHFSRRLGGIFGLKAALK